MRGHVPHSDLMMAKARTLFAVYDHDKNGSIEKADFETICENFVRARSLSPSGPESQELKRLFLAIWEELSQLADEDGDGRVTFQEMLAYLDLLTHDPVLFHDQVFVLSDLLFCLLDTDRDESVTAKEYQEFARCFRFESSLDNFFKLSRGAEALAAPQLRKRVQEFYFSENPDAPGNLFFGTLVDAS